MYVPPAVVNITITLFLLLTPTDVLGSERFGIRNNRDKSSTASSSTGSSTTRLLEDDAAGDLVEASIGSGTHQVSRILQGENVCDCALLGDPNQRAECCAELADDIADPEECGCLQQGPSTTINATCFSASSTVQVRGKKESVPMKDLRVGDKIRTGVSTTLSYETIYAFGHWQPKMTASFLQITTTTNTENTTSTLEVTHQHLIYVHGKSSPVRSEAIQIGDWLQAATMPRLVVDIQQITKDGVYAPLTASGRLIVDGIQASSYVSLQDPGKDFYHDVTIVRFRNGMSTGIPQHNLIHMALVPFRIACRLSPTATSCNSYDEETGMPYYILYCLQLVQWVDTSTPTLIQCVLLLLFGMTFGVLSLLESFVFGGERATTITTTCIGLLVLWCVGRFPTSKLGKSHR